MAPAAADRPPVPGGAQPAAGGRSTRTWVVVPTFNERENIGPLVRALMAQAGLRVLVVDDQSPDGTGEVADELARVFAGRVEVLHRVGRRGLGRAYIEAFRYLLASREADVICQMDADLSHDPAYLPAMIEATGSYDVVVGSRYLTGVSVVNWPLRRLVLSVFANNYVRFITRMAVRDCTAGFRAWRRDAIARLPLERLVADGYAFAVEMIYEAHRLGLRITEVPIIFVERRVGQSKLSLRVLVESILMPWRLVLSRRALPFK